MTDSSVRLTTRYGHGCETPSELQLRDALAELFHETHADLTEADYAEHPSTWLDFGQKACDAWTVFTLRIYRSGTRSGTVVFTKMADQDDDDPEFEHKLQFVTEGQALALWRYLAQGKTDVVLSAFTEKLQSRSKWCYREAVRQANELQEMERMLRGVSWGIGELMQIAVEATRYDRDWSIRLYRMLFKSRSSEPLRPPGLGQPGLLGGALLDCLPDYPFHVHGGVLFHIVRGYIVGGRPETAPEYRACCIQNGAWNETPYERPSEECLAIVLDDFVASGPWTRPLDKYEIEFLRSQVS